MLNDRRGSHYNSSRHPKLCSENFQSNPQDKTLPIFFLELVEYGLELFNSQDSPALFSESLKTTLGENYFPNEWAVFLANRSAASHWDFLPRCKCFFFLYILEPLPSCVN